MIQFNLLPDVKLQFIKARRIQRLVTLFSCCAAIVTLAIMLNLLLYVNVVQKNHIASLNKQINDNTDSLKSTPNLSSALTMDGQVNAIPGLYNSNPVASRLFGFLSEITPTQASIASFTINFTAHTISFSGSANNLATVTELVDTIKSATYQASNGSTPNAFSQVSPSGFGYSSTSGATYSIAASFAPAIFSNTNSISSLIIPNVVVNRSTSLFEQSTTSGQSGG